MDETHPDTRPPVELPDPTTLEEARQQRVAARFTQRVATTGLAVVAWVNLSGGVIGGAMFSAGPLAWLGIVVLTALPVAGLLAVNAWFQRLDRSAAERLRGILGPPSPGPRSVAATLVGVGLAVAALAALGIGWTRAFVALGFAAVGVAAPFMRRRVDPDLPPRAMLLAGAWLAVAGSWGLLLPVDGKTAWLIGMLWGFLGPFGLLGLVVAGPVEGAVPRDDRVGALARWWAPLLPLTRAVRVRRKLGDPAAALRAVTLLAQRPVRGVWLVEALAEAGACLADLRDPRALGVWALLAEVAPEDPRGFAGLARLLQHDDPERALAYARFAEDDAARQLGGGDPEVTALRAELEAGLRG